MIFDHHRTDKLVELTVGDLLHLHRLHGIGAGVVHAIKDLQRVPCLDRSRCGGAFDDDRVVALLLVKEAHMTHDIDAVILAEAEDTILDGGGTHRKFKLASGACHQTVGAGHTDVVYTL